MPPKKDTTNLNPKDLDESIQHTNLRIDELILANRNVESTIDFNNENMHQQLKELDNSFNDRMKVGFLELGSLMTQQLNQQFAALSTVASPSRSATPSIDSSLLQPTSSENVVINTSFPLLHVPLPLSQPQNLTTTPNMTNSTPIPTHFLNDTTFNSNQPSTLLHSSTATHYQTFTFNLLKFPTNTLPTALSPTKPALSPIFEPTNLPSPYSTKPKN
ncbi:unnamed protein product [Vicia faba]|uniref:Uncharacterized protein n=1 Tax=Vicia faba TaxID=3906 RepID=A0AAV0ZUB4_VICFA|nr:unnamed protein product [Vicia faba]